ncbi:hypothetical protein F0562_016512 [Nyssa sinensis]|uniref:Transcription factor n=1 Tax=Nyssa sinensis TaxID=561372 RepID=A0A5J4ZLR4_9ASTE|nr:hypothetical protein F0562_016512 [Nyssa sinensis]
MGRAPCCDKANVKRGPWSPEEDAKLKEYIEKYGTGGNWIALPQKAGLRRCGKSCRLRWLNYLRPNIKHGEFSDDEDRIIYNLFATIGSRWSIIAAQLPGRTDNDIKNYWNTKLKKKLMGMISSSHKRTHQVTAYPSISLLQTSSVSYSAPSPALSSSSAAYKCVSNPYYTTPTSSFTGYDHQPISIPSNLLNSTCSSSTASANTILQVAQESYVGPMHHYQVKDHNLLMFGGTDQASCSSSDGSCNNQITRGKDIDQYDHQHGVSNGEQIGLQSFYFNGVDESQKFMLSNVDNLNEYAEKPNGILYGEAPLIDYGLEEIKQLISTHSCNNFNFFVDEIKTEEKVLYC